MLPKNYSQNGKNKSGGSDTLGIVLIIVFSFLLLCAVTGGLILGDIGKVVKDISIGFLGYFSYPVFLYCIIRGIFLLQNKKPGISIGKAISLIAAFTCAAIIVHLATTSGWISGGFGAYNDLVYHGKTMGGVFLGMFAYALALVLTPVGAYILLACIILALLAFVAGVFGKTGTSRVKKRKVPSVASERIKGGTKFIGNGQDLFIQSIIPRDNDNSAPRSMDDLPDDNYNANRNRNNYGYDNGYDGMTGNSYAREPAREVSPEIERMNKMVDERYNQIRERSRDAWGIPGAQNDYQPTDYDRNTGYSSKAWEEYIPTVPPKDVRSKMVNGEIIRGFDNGDVGPVSRNNGNGYDYGRRDYGRNDYGASSGYQGGYYDRGPQKTQVEGNSIHFSMDDIKQDSYKAMYDSYAPERAKYPSKPDIKIVQSKPESYFDFPEPVQPAEPEPVPETKTRAPIINASEVEPEVAEPAAPVQPVTPVKEERKRAPIIDGSSVTADEPYVSEPPVIDEQPQKSNPAPIIIGSRFDEELKKSDEQKQEQIKKRAPIMRSEEEVEKAQAAVDVSDSQNAVNDDSLDENHHDLPEKTTSVEKSDAVSRASENGRTDSAEQFAHNDSDSIPALPEESEDETSQIENEHNFAAKTEENDNCDYSVGDGEDYPEVNEDDLTAEEYMEIYGRPKFFDVSKQDSDKLSANFEKNSTSFNFVDEVEDASENTKRNFYDSVKHEENKPVVAAQPIKTTSANSATIADKTDKKEIAATASEHKEEPKKPKKPYKYTAPDIDLLTTESTIPKINPEVYEEKKSLLESTLSTFGINATVKNIIVGPTVTRYELDMPVGVSVKKIAACESDIMYSLACDRSILIQSPIPGKKAVGIDVPNEQNALVALKDIIDSPEFKSSSSPLTIALGKDIQGKVMVTRIDKMPHLLMAGTTGSGKSACLNSLIVSLLYKSSPEDVRLILIDPKRVEFTAYSGLPHMMIPDAITEPVQALNAFKWAREEMERRYKQLQAYKVRNISEYNNLDDVKNRVIDKMPYIVVIVDEFADLMISSNTDKKRELENLISSIAGKARAAGIHLILATQRPSSDVITGTIKANLPCRIAFAVSNRLNSRIILDNDGAESLLGKGDMLFAPQDAPTGIRIQGAFIDNDEVNNIVEEIKATNVCEYDEEFEKALVEQPANEADGEIIDSDDIEEMGYDKDLPNIARMVVQSGKASGSTIQRRFGLGYQRAVKIIDQMEKFGFIGPYNGSKAREVYLTKEKFEEFFGEKFDDD